MKIQYFAGWLLITVIGLLSGSLSELITIGGKHPVEAVLLAVILGVLIRTLDWVPASCEPGVKAFEKLLIVGIVLVGASLDFSGLLAKGGSVVSVVLITMAVGGAAIWLLARAAKISDTLSVLLAVGTTICGGTAIAVIAPLIDARDEETSYAIGTVAIWGIVALVFYPLIAAALGVTDDQFGLFAGTAIHSTPQVVGAGFIFSEQAGRTATAVKLLRNCFLAPAALLIAFWYSKRKLTQEAGEPNTANLAKAFPWFLFGYFLMAWCAGQGYFSPEGIKAFTRAGKFFILLGMAGIGLNTELRAIRSVGFKPLGIGLLGSLIVAACSILMISFQSL